MEIFARRIPLYAKCQYLPFSKKRTESVGILSVDAVKLALVAAGPIVDTTTHGQVHCYVSTLTNSRSRSAGGNYSPCIEDLRTEK